MGKIISLHYSLFCQLNRFCFHSIRQKAISYLIVWQFFLVPQIEKGRGEKKNGEKKKTKQITWMPKRRRWTNHSQLSWADFTISTLSSHRFQLNFIRTEQEVEKRMPKLIIISVENCRWNKCEKFWFSIFQMKCYSTNKCIQIDQSRSKINDRWQPNEMD